MSTCYHELLEATIRHLEQLKAGGVRFVRVSPAALTALAEKPSTRFQQTAAKGAATEVESELSIAFGRRATMPIENQASIAVSKPSVQAAKNSGSLTTPLNPEAKAQAMAQLREKAMACVKCAHLVAARKNVVFGVGDINSPLMFVGEAPGADEDVLGEPFVGRAGQLLTRIILAMGLSRETVYIANILKCRPDTPGQSAGNRKPTPPEMETCIPYLQQQIDLIKPKVIVALGGTAVEGLLGKPVFITKARGQWQTYRDIPLMPTFHPSYLLRPENALQKRSVWEDMLQVMEKLSLPINEKQRGYFLKA
jgi:DNA polymerase